MRLARLALLTLLLAAPISAQETVVIDSVGFYALGAPASLLITAGPSQGYVGDTITLSYSIRDEEGNPTLAIVDWTVSPPTSASILSATDSTVTFVPLSPGNLRLIATITRVDSLVIAGTSPEGFFWGRDGFALRVGEQAQLCAFFYAGPSIIATSNPAECEPLIEPEPPHQPLPSLRVALLLSRGVRATPAIPLTPVSPWDLAG